MKRVSRNQIKSSACFLYALEIYLWNECEQYLSLGNVLQNDPIAIQQNSDVLHIINDADVAPTAESVSNLPHFVHGLFVLKSSAFKNMNCYFNFPNV